MRREFVFATATRSKRKAACRARIPASLSPVPSASRELPGLTARLDKLCYHHGGASLPPDKPHAFVYFITIRNGSDRTVTLLGRKWVVLHADGSRLVIEGDKIVGETPRLAPGENFPTTAITSRASMRAPTGAFTAWTSSGHKIHVILPGFDLVIPRDGPCDI